MKDTFNMSQRNDLFGDIRCSLNKMVKNTRQAQFTSSFLFSNSFYHIKTGPCSSCFCQGVFLSGEMELCFCHSCLCALLCSFLHNMFKSQERKDVYSLLAIVAVVVEKETAVGNYMSADFQCVQ